MLLLQHLQQYLALCPLTFVMTPGLASGLREAWCGGNRLSADYFVCDGPPPEGTLVGGLRAAFVLSSLACTSRATDWLT